MKQPKIALYLIIAGLLAFIGGLWLLMKKASEDSPVTDNHSAEHMAKMRAAKAAKKVEADIESVENELILDSKINLKTDESAINEN